MHPPELHRWDVSQEEAVEIQKRLRSPTASLDPMAERRKAICGRS
jgi:hypothetical protein